MESITIAAKLSSLICRFIPSTNFAFGDHKHKINLHEIKVLLENLDDMETVEMVFPAFVNGALIFAVVKM